MDPRQLRLHLLAQLEVERAERLVEEQDGGLLGQRPGERDPLLLAAGQLGGQPIDEPAQPDQLEVLTRPVRSISAVPRPSIRSPKATFWATVMCGKRA